MSIESENMKKPQYRKNISTALLKKRVVTLPADSYCGFCKEVG
jgi:hypothetical protein